MSFFDENDADMEDFILIDQELQRIADELIDREQFPIVLKQALASSAAIDNESHD